MQLACLFISTFIQVFFVLRSYVKVFRIFSYSKLPFILEEPAKLEAVVKFAFIWDRVVYLHELNGITVVEGRKG